MIKSEKIKVESVSSDRLTPRGLELWVRLSSKVRNHLLLTAELLRYLEVNLWFGTHHQIEDLLQWTFFSEEVGRPIFAEILHVSVCCVSQLCLAVSIPKQGKDPSLFPLLIPMQFLLC
ncbi:Udp-Glucuronosyltransferase 2B15 [Manis pentadactyla]|nr:Udp-Glucuronosyltransferase 2B15 [Manis pentadactyla]